jgi:hypothetical protein
MHQRRGEKTGEKTRAGGATAHEFVFEATHNIPLFTSVLRISARATSKLRPTRGCFFQHSTALPAQGWI